MKSRLAAAAYSFFAGTCCRNTRRAMSSRPMFTFFHRRNCEISCSFQALGFESSSRAVHSSAIEDDAFSELGSDISECSTKKIKLVTEKPDQFLDDDFRELGPEISECSTKKIKLVTGFLDDDDFAELGLGISECSVKQIKLITEKPDFMKRRARKKELASRPFSADNMPDAKDIIATIGKPYKTSCAKLGGHGHAPQSTDDTRKISDIESSRSVSIKNIPSTIDLTELIEAISVFGKVSGATFVNASDRLRCCKVEFDDVESSRRAILSGKITWGSQVFPVDPLDAVDLVTIRIKSINEKTTDYAIHSICKSVGEFVGLTRTSKDCVDAFFNVQNHSIHLDILQKLNNTTLDLNRWSAHVVTSKSKSSEVTSDEEARSKLGLQIFDHFSELKRQLTMKRIYLEDLEYLNASIMHIEAVPPATNQSGSK